MRKLALLVLLAPTIALAWGGDGHAQVADIAWIKLTPESKAKIEKILAAGEPSFRANDGNVRDAFSRSSNFCDYIKGKSNTIYEDVISVMNSKFEPGIEQTGSEGVRCKTWHYYDIPIRYKGETPKVRPSNALVALNFAIEQLTQMQKAGSSDLKMQCWWLYWINHIVGDLHQPLHCCSSHEVHEEGDDGGNKFMIKSPDQDRKVRLHGFWDGGIGRAIGAEKEAGLSPNVVDVTERWTNDKMLLPTDVEAKRLDVMSWLKDGAVLAEKEVYSGVEADQAPDSKYVSRQLTLCKKQAVLAGIRLANLLNKILK